MSSSPAVALQQVRKPYTITKQRERWTEEEHLRFLDALKLYGRAWRRIEEHIGSKTAVQIRSHAQKFFSKLEREGGGGLDIEIPPPRPKRKPSHPYPKKAGMSSPTSGEKSKTTSCVVEESTKSLESPPPRSRSQRGLKLFGKTVLVDVPTEELEDEPSSTDAAVQNREEESGVESGSPREQFANNSSCQSSLEVSSQRPDESSHQFGLNAEQMAANNLFFFSLIASSIQQQGPGPGGQAHPWKLWQPDSSRRNSFTDSNSPVVDKTNSSWESQPNSDADGKVAGKRRRRALELDEETRPRSSSSSTTTSTSDADESGSCTGKTCGLSTRLSLDGRSSGFLPYKRPSQR